MCHLVFREALEMIGNRLSAARQDERTAADEGAEEDLQAAITADVIKCAPYRRPGATLDRRREARDIVADQLGRAGGSGRKQRPRSGAVPGLHSGGPDNGVSFDIK